MTLTNQNRPRSSLTPFRKGEFGGAFLPRRKRGEAGDPEARPLGAINEAGALHHRIRSLIW